MTICLYSCHTEEYDRFIIVLLAMEAFVQKLPISVRIKTSLEITKLA